MKTKLCLERTSRIRLRNVRLIAAMVAASFPFAVLGQTDDCTGEQFLVAQAEINESLAAIRRSQPLTMLQAKLTKLGWSTEKQKESLNLAFASDPLAGLSKQRHAHLLKLGEEVAASSGPNSRISKCSAATRVKVLANRIVAVNQQQYDLAARAMGVASEAGK